MKLDGTFIATADNLTIVFKQKTYTFKIPNNLGVIIRLLRENKFQKAIDSINEKMLISAVTNGVIKETKDGKYKIGKKVIPENIQKIIDKVVSEKQPVDAVIALWNRINSVSDDLTTKEQRISKESMFDFLVNCCVKITEDGCFIAYKKVRDDYMDCHSGKFDNSPGKIVSMPRENVTLDRNESCSSGLHVGAWSYVHSFGGTRVIECLIDPRDVVSVPFDYKNSKMRVCRYKVIRDVTEALSDPSILLASSTIYEGYSDPIEETKVVKKIVEKKTPEKKAQTKFEISRVSEDRLPITKSLVSELGLSAGAKIGIMIDKKEIRIMKADRISEFELTVNKDGSVRISKTIVDRLSKKQVLVGRFETVGKNKKVLVITEK